MSHKLIARPTALAPLRRFGPTARMCVCVRERRRPPAVVTEARAWTCNDECVIRLQVWDNGSWVRVKWDNTGETGCYWIASMWTCLPHNTGSAPRQPPPPCTTRHAQAQGMKHGRMTNDAYVCTFIQGDTRKDDTEARLSCHSTLCPNPSLSLCRQRGTKRRAPELLRLVFSG